MLPIWDIFAPIWGPIWADQPADGPVLDLNFVPGQPVPAGIIVARATPKLQEYPAGTVTVLGNNAGSIEAHGLVIEAAHTNATLQSQTFDNASWTKQGTATVNANATTAPDGTMTADELTIAQSGNGIFQVTSIPAGKTAPSVWIKKISSSGLFRIEDPANGLGRWTIDLSAVGSGWERIDATHPAVTINTPFNSGANTISGLFFYAPSGATLSFYVWQSDQVPGAYSQSAVPTTTASATCNRDSVFGSAGDIAKLPIASGSVEVDFTPEWSDATSPSTAAILDTRSGTPNNGFALYVASNKLSWKAETATALQSTALSWTAGQQYKLKAVWGSGNVSLYRDNVLVASITDGSATMPAGETSLVLGSLFDGSAPLDGAISRVRFPAP